MRVKDSTVETKFHPILTNFLFEANEIYRAWGGELIVTSGSEPDTRHSKTSLHYADPCCAADIRSWAIWDAMNPEIKITAETQAATLQKFAKAYCKRLGIPAEWLEIILESDHIHIEYQPKRVD